MRALTRISMVLARYGTITRWVLENMPAIVDQVHNLTIFLS